MRRTRLRAPKRRLACRRSARSPAASWTREPHPRPETDCVASASDPRSSQTFPRPRCSCFSPRWYGDQRAYRNADLRVGFVGASLVFDERQVVVMRAAAATFQQSDQGQDLALLSASAVQPQLDEPTNLLVLSERERAPVTSLCFVAAAEATKHVSASEVERRVLFQGPGALDALEECQALDRAYREGDGNGPIQLDDGRAFVVQELIVQDSNLAPICVRCSRCLSMDRGDRALDLIGAGPPHAERLFYEPNALLDLRAFPFGPILILEQHQVALVANARLAP